MAKSKLSPDEAKEYSNSLAKAAAGDYELMDFAINTLGVPDALGMEAQEWVDSIGGYIRMSVDARRQAVKELQEEGRSISQTATILGIGETTVVMDRRYIKVLADEEQKALPEKTGEEPDLAREEKKWSQQDVRDLIDEGKSDAQIAIVTGYAVGSVGKLRKAYDKERSAAEQPSDKLKQAQAEKQAALDKIPKAERKAQEAAFEDFVADFKKEFTQAAGVYLRPLAQELRLEMQRVMDGDLEMVDYDLVTALVLETATELWVYGAKHGHDVARITDTLDRLRGGE